MRLPVIQILLALYFVALIALAITIKRITIWVLTSITLIALLVNVGLFFSGSDYGFTNEPGLTGLVAQALSLPFTFLLLPLFLIVEAFRIRHKLLIILASIAVLPPIVFVILFSMSDM